ncbi:hypothetical protein ACHAXN_001106, partial [Cyclotella atomus]
SRTSETSSIVDLRGLQRTNQPEKTSKHWQLIAINTRVGAANVANMDIKVVTARMKEKEVLVSEDLAIIVERKDTSKQTVRSNARQKQFIKRKQYVQLTKYMMKKKV